jgi:ribosomal small subunit protein bTHX
MGRGDKKSKKGKIAKGSYGKSRNKNAIKAKLKRTASSKKGSAPAAAAPAAAKPKRTNTKKKAEA